ncbi:hypothetical protein A4X09_0g6192 [Tilletia walkeri]|uniref:Protein LTV1 n=1 Tax=Tilletia walkeri TaxID=117179 RepID=A0A8X7N4W3_9BASI|nr:hypothetical protein A4X09_0g6192 [Tilletia walkeri]
MAPSIWRSKEAQHFQVVHRSQRDPLINDPLASHHVLKQVNRPNESGTSRTGTSRADLEAANPDLTKTRPNVGEASLYGIYFDDTNYDYMQHLRPIQGDFHSKRGGEDEPEEVATIMLNAKPNRQEQRRQQKAQGPITLKEDEATSSKALNLPADVLPPEESTMRKNDYADQLGVNPSIAGLQPDMDPHLRQALEALDDEAFLTLGAKEDVPKTVEAAAPVVEAPEAEDVDVDDFFGQILAGGEVDESDFGLEDGPEAKDWRALPPGGDEQMWQPHTWTAAEMAVLKQRRELQDEGDAPPQAKQSHARVARSRISAGTATSSIFSATSKRKPGQRARLAASVAPSLNDGRTEWSMTSSSMRRNKGLSTLDDQFEALQRRYDEEEGFNEEDEDEEFEDDDDDEEGEEEGSVSGSSAHPDVAAHHEALFDKFLSSAELVGRRFEEALGPSGVKSLPSERLGAWRDALGPLEEKYKLAALERKEDDDLPAEADPTFPWRREPKSSRQSWDVETILSTHSNVSNHPRLIRARDAASVAGTATTAHRGPSVISEPKSKNGKNDAGDAEGSVSNGTREGQDDDEDSDYESDATEVPTSVTITRDRNETAEEKKARKLATKENKQARRQQKSARKAAFANEHKRQVHMASARTAGGAAADVGRNGIPLPGGRAAITL